MNFVASWISSPTFCHLTAKNLREIILNVHVLGLKGKKPNEQLFDSQHVPICAEKKIANEKESHSTCRLCSKEKFMSHSNISDDARNELTKFHLLKSWTNFLRAN